MRVLDILRVSVVVIMVGPNHFLLDRVVVLRCFFSLRLFIRWDSSIHLYSCGVAYFRMFRKIPMKKIVFICVVKNMFINLCVLLWSGFCALLRDRFA